MDTTIVRQYLLYDPDTGVFIWKTTASNRAVEGSVAGYKTDTGYVCIKIEGVRYYAHRLAWLFYHGEWPQDQLDHINHVKDDNSIRNLREVSTEENGKNQPLTSRNTSGVQGVHYDRCRDRWFAQIYYKQKAVFLGRFKTKAEATKVREAAASKYNFHNNHGK